MKRKQKFPNETVERLTALRGILNMHERAIKAGISCKLNGESRDFDMNHWDCGTAACALGSAAHHPWFKERGLHIRPMFSGEGGFPNFEGAEDLEAGVKFFSITHDESSILFDPSTYGYGYHYITPAMVRYRVDQLIEKYSK